VVVVDSYYFLEVLLCGQLNLLELAFFL